MSGIRTAETLLRRLDGQLLLFGGIFAAIGAGAVRASANGVASFLWLLLDMAALILSAIGAVAGGALVFDWRGLAVDAIRTPLAPKPAESMNPATVRFLGRALGLVVVGLAVGIGIATLVDVAVRFSQI